MDALLDSVKVAALICAAPFALAGLAALGEWITRRPMPPREHFADPATDRWREDTNDFFHPTGRVSTAVAFARSGQSTKSEPRTVVAVEALTSKEIDHAGTSK